MKTLYVIAFATSFCFIGCRTGSSGSAAKSDDALPVSDEGGATSAAVAHGEPIFTNPATNDADFAKGAKMALRKAFKIKVAAASESTAELPALKLNEQGDTLSCALTGLTDGTKNTGDSVKFPAGNKFEITGKGFT